MIDEDSAALLMVRMKKDKKIGENMSVKNSLFREELEKNVTMLMKDLEMDRFEVFEI